MEKKIVIAKSISKEKKITLKRRYSSHTFRYGYLVTT